MVLAVLIDGSCFSCGESSYISKFFKNTLERPIFVCFKESDCLKYVSALVKLKGEVSSSGKDLFCAEKLD